MKKVKGIYGIMLVFLLTTSCIGFMENTITGNGNVQTEIREVGTFHGIDAAAGLNVYVEFGEYSPEVKIVADENLHEYIITEVNDGILKVKSRRGIRNAEYRDVFVKAGQIDELEVSSAAHLRGENLLISDFLSIEVSSAGDIELDFEANKADVEVSSSGSANLRGSVSELDAEVSSAGNLNAGDLISKNVHIEASSAGDATVHVIEFLDAEASSAGNVRYLGNPSQTSISNSSAGSIKKK